MIEALKTSGIKLPSVKQRIWTWLHDRGRPATAREISTALALRPPRASQECSQMAARGMLKGAQEDFRKHAGAVPTLRTVYSAVGREFEMAPPTVEEINRRREANTRYRGKTGAKSLAKDYVIPQKPTENDGPSNPFAATVAASLQGRFLAPAPEQINLDDMTLRQLREMYGRLRRIFEAEQV